MSAQQDASALGRWRTQLGAYVPGIGLSALVAATAVALEAVLGRALPVPAMVLALLVGILLHPLARQPRFAAGMSWCVKRLLRMAIALLGLRIALGDIVALGLPTAVMVILAMVATLAAGLFLARLLRVAEGYGALAGMATAVCGASAALATTTVLPNYKQKTADVTFTVVMANAVSTVVMVAYPALCLLLGLGPEATGIMLGASIHDMAQVVGAGFAVSDETGETAVIVKLFRIFLLLPMVLAVGWWFRRAGGEVEAARVPVPVFALVFLAFCLLNSVAAEVPGFAPVYAPMKAALVQLSGWGLLVSIAALGLGTSLGAMFRIGWRHVAVFAGTTLVILLIALAGATLLA